MDAPTDESPAPRLAPGTVLRGRFQIDRFVRHLGWAELYVGTDTTDRKPVHLRLIGREFVAQSPVRIRLQQDGAIAAQLDHKNISAHYGFFTDGDNAFVAGEPADGSTLREMLERKQAAGRAFSLKGAFNIVTHLCNALEHAHAAMPHGLLGLDTVHVNAAGRVKIVDFGLSRALATQEAFRTAIGLGVTTMAPEYFSAGDPDRRADLYSVAAILFELMTGRSREGEEKLSAVVAGAPAALDEVIDRCMRALPEERYRDALELKLAIHGATEDAMADRPAAPPPTPRPPPPPVARPVALPTPSLGTLIGDPPGPPAAWSPPAGGVVLPPPPAPNLASSPAVPAVASTPAGVDDQHERWLIQKDRLDLGPFKLADVKLQIEKGQIVGEHMIVDMENGSRVRVREHPLLKDLVQRAEGVLQTMRELEQTQAEQRAHRKRVLLVTGIVAVAVLVAGGGIGLYAYKQQQKTEIKVVTVEREASDEFKIDNIQLKVDPPAPKKKPGSARPHAAGGKVDEFDAVTNLGDASEGGGDETLSQEVVNQVMTRNFGVLKGCLFEEKRRDPSTTGVEFEFIIRGSGQVSKVRANGKTDSPLATCIYGKIQAVPFPKFNGSRTHASFSLALR